jgi:alkylated DNA repair dioxygenase AlkB
MIVRGFRYQVRQFVHYNNEIPVYDVLVLQYVHKSESANKHRLSGIVTTMMAAEETRAEPSTTASSTYSNNHLPLELIHPSPIPCKVPDHLCPRNEANELVKINGLRYYRNFYSPTEQAELLAAIYTHPWQKILARRQQFYGEVYYHTNYRNTLLQPNHRRRHHHADADADADAEITNEPEEVERETPLSLNMDGLLTFLAPKCQAFFGDDVGFPSQILVNEYLNNLGIASHYEDFHAFGPIILTLSLVSPVYMTLKKPKVRTNHCHEYWDIQKILLEPGSLLVMEDEARNDYRHGISKYKWVILDGQEPICRDAEYRRVSVTMRHLLQTRRKVDVMEDESSGWRYRASSGEES